MLRKLLYPVWLVCGLLVLAGPVGVGAEEAELIIVKFGKLSVKSTVPEAKVYVDDTYKGHTDSIIDDIMVGEHAISCRTETQTVSGKFSIKKDEVLKLEARFDEGTLTLLVEHPKPAKVEPEKKPEAEKKIEAEKKTAKPAAPKPELPKKPVVVAKKEEKKNPEEERRSLYLNVIKVLFDDIDAQEVRIVHKINPTVVGKFNEKKEQSGTYYRTKKDLLLCDAGPCEQHWSATFSYADEKGESDTFGLNWKQTVFNGITPGGTSKRDLLWCINGACKNLVDATLVNVPQTVEVGRYQLMWTRSSLIIRRSDIMKEVVEAGGALEAY